MGVFCFGHLGDVEVIMVLFGYMGVFCFILKAPFFMTFSTQTLTKSLHICRIG